MTVMSIERLRTAARELRQDNLPVTLSTLESKTGYPAPEIRNYATGIRGLRGELFSNTDRILSNLAHMRAAKEIRKSGLEVTCKTLAEKMRISRVTLRKQLSRRPEWREEIGILSELEVRQGRRKAQYEAAARELFDGRSPITQAAIARKTGIPTYMLAKDFGRDRFLPKLLFRPPSRKSSAAK